MLGFVGQQIGNTAVIIPPVRDVPAGAFTMGDGSDNPKGQITVGAFHIGTYAVTAAEYALAVTAGVVSPPPTTYFAEITWQSQKASPDYPVVNVTWHAALAYVRWLSALTKQPWRLVTEAEWEKAARGTDGRAYPWGNTFDSARVDYSGRSPVGTHPSGASPYGVLDMAHKVFEWCSSLDRSYPYVAADGRENLTDTTGNRVLRSCSWDRPSFAGATYARSSQPPSTASATNGFRLARSVS
jgi:formylglycine-generating enzyme required for sulfatase activity